MPTGFLKIQRELPITRSETSEKAGSKPELTCERAIILGQLTANHGRSAMARSGPWKPGTGQLDFNSPDSSGPSDSAEMAHPSLFRSLTHLHQKATDDPVSSVHYTSAHIQTPSISLLANRHMLQVISQNNPVV